MSDLLTVDDLASLLRTTPTAVRRLRERGTLPPAIKVGSRVLWDAGDFREWLDGRREPDGHDR
jgi:excisionase family DNA binding protein